MASVNRDSRGWRVLVQIGEERPTIRLGRNVRERDAHRFGENVQTLATAHRIGAKLDDETGAWLAKLPPRIYNRLAAVGLVPNRAKTEFPTLGKLRDTFDTTVKVKLGTVAAYKQGLDSLVKFFGRDHLLSSISPLDADRWRQSLVDEKLAPATVSKRVQTARNLFRKAVRWQMLAESPFDLVKAGRQDNPDRARFIDRAMIAKVLECCPDHEWRLIVGLSRFAGLRCPSEHLSLTWTDWDVDRGALTVRAAKTNSVRYVPVAPELARLLQDSYDAAEPGATWIIARYRQPNSNLRTQLNRIIGKAKLTPWPRLFHNLRSSAQTEWAEQYPLASVCRWLGNSPAVAATHYLQARDTHFEAAVAGDGSAKGPRNNRGEGTVARPVAQYGPEQPDTDRHRSGKDRAGTPVLQGVTDGCPSVQKEKVGAGGFEPP